MKATHEIKWVDVHGVSSSQDRLHNRCRDVRGPEGQPGCEGGDSKASLGRNAFGRLPVTLALMMAPTERNPMKTYTQECYADVVSALMEIIRHDVDLMESLEDACSLKDSPVARMIAAAIDRDRTIGLTGSEPSE